MTGDDDINYREKVVKQLEDGKLEYILTVDIFNEGIDIPSVNQVVMLRNTQSSIILFSSLVVDFVNIKVRITLLSLILLVITKITI